MSLNTQQGTHYRLLSLLGQNDTGEVYLAEETRTGRQVALKLIHNEYLPYRNPQAVNKALYLFQRETRVLARLNHPGILPLSNYGQVIVNGKAFISFAMPICPEGSLAAWYCRRDKPPLLSLHEADHLLAQAATILQDAHNQHIIHLHIKPENLLIRSRADSSLPDLFLADFGVAKFVATISAINRRAHGSPIYMPPEQWEGHPASATDQYALAVIIYQLLTGRPPYIGSHEQIIYQHFHIQPQPPGHFNRHIPPAIDAVIIRALAKRPEERFDSISTFASTFHQILYNPVSSSHLAPQSAGSPVTLIPASKPANNHHVYPLRAVVIGLLILALLILVSGIGSNFVQSDLGTTAPTPLVARATATVQAATATAIMRKANPNPYSPHAGTLVISDPMTGDHFNWTTGSTNDAACAFTNSAYHVIGKRSKSVNPCTGSGILFSNYNNFVFEVQMSIISGTGGGIRFHISSVGSYNFVVYQDGSYELTTYDSYGNYRSKLLRTTTRSAIKTGLKQTNLIAVVVNGKQIDLYVNNVRIGSTQDSFSRQGSFALVADQQSEVAFNNARLWAW